MLPCSCDICYGNKNGFIFKVDMYVITNSCKFGMFMGFFNQKPDFA
ncbi:hypothetical protein ESCAB7627_2595 [Escherichia albertii TW07627]|uniref:Uncharacterized protein n=1 Tax=Escherichia albertii (strain TW07627) TaxID=502347 RepID=A0ABC9NNS4_ESCAT|nr:hypothetical protein ESCAB7627_2595 [Escherichia albertii TW07627]